MLNYDLVLKKCYSIYNEKNDINTIDDELLKYKIPKDYIKEFVFSYAVDYGKLSVEEFKILFYSNKIKVNFINSNILNNALSCEEPNVEIIQLILNDPRIDIKKSKIAFDNFVAAGNLTNTKVIDCLLNSKHLNKNSKNYKILKSWGS